MTEYGGIAFANIGEQGELGGTQTWGYRGYCYTQLTDVMQEINGVLTADRRPKVEIGRFAEANQAPLRF